MTEIKNSKHESGRFDLEERTFIFAVKVKNFIKLLPKNTANYEYAKQLIRSSGSIAANYIEANESMSRKDLSYRMNTCRREAKESRLWLRLVEIDHQKNLLINQNELIDECWQLVKIFTAIINKIKAKAEQKN